MDNLLGFLGCFYLIPSLIIGGIGFLLGWFLKPKNRVTGDLSVEGEGALRAEADSLRARVQDLEGRIATRDGEVSDLKTKLASAAAGAAAAGAVATAAKTTDDDETYALEWQNRYLAARVKYLESRIAEAPESAATTTAKATAKTTTAKPKSSKTKAAGASAAAATGAATLAAASAAKPKPKAKAAPKPKAAAKSKPKAAAKPKAKAAPKPKVLYTDGPTDGAPDDLKMIKGIGPKFEKDLNNKGIYYFRQIGAWKRKDVDMVEGVIDSFPGRIDRDGWIPQAKQLAKGGAAKTAKTKAVAKPKTRAVSKTATSAPAKTSKSKASANDRYFESVRKYDSRASRTVVDNIVKYCGVSLKSRDSSLVACSDEAELKRVASGFVTKKLGMSDGQMDLVKDVCQQMKAQRQKSRVTFYYLAAKKAKKLDLFR